MARAQWAFSFCGFDMILSEYDGHAHFILRILGMSGASGARCPLTKPGYSRMFVNGQAERTQLVMSLEENKPGLSTMCRQCVSGSEQPEQWGHDRKTRAFQNRKEHDGRTNEKAVRVLVLAVHYMRKERGKNTT